MNPENDGLVSFKDVVAAEMDRRNTWRTAVAVTIREVIFELGITPLDVKAALQRVHERLTKQMGD